MSKWVRRSAVFPSPCAQCCSKRLVSGRLRDPDGGEAIRFKPDEVRNRFWRLSVDRPEVEVIGITNSRLDCGQLSAHVNPEQLREKIRRFGTEERQRLAGIDFCTELTPAPNSPGRGDEPSPAE